VAVLVFPFGSGRSRDFCTRASGLILESYREEGLKQTMALQVGFLEAAKKKLRPQALAGVVESGEYALLWARLLVAHFLKLGAALAGIDVDIIRVVSLMEKWVWIASFAMFFFRVVIRLRRTRG